MEVYALAQQRGTLLQTLRNKQRICILIEHYLQPKSDSKLTVKIITDNGREIVIGTSKAQKNYQVREKTIYVLMNCQTEETSMNI